jgi:hypothetical protein
MLDKGGASHGLGVAVGARASPAGYCAIYFLRVNKGMGFNTQCQLPVLVASFRQHSASTGVQLCSPLTTPSATRSLTSSSSMVTLPTLLSGSCTLETHQVRHA